MDQTLRPPTAPPIPSWGLRSGAPAPRLPFGAEDGRAVKLTEKYRPARFSDVVGQPYAVSQLLSFVDSPYPCAFIFHGPSGVGKTSLARCLATELGVNENWDLSIVKSGAMDAETVEDTLRLLRFSGHNGGWKLIIVDEADSMSAKAKMLWLSALEDLPGKSVVIFTTNHLDKFEGRFVQRCEELEFRADVPSLLVYVQERVDAIWLAETGRTDAPRVADMRSVIRDGQLSVRGAIAALEPILRAAKSGQASPVHCEISQCSPSVAPAPETPPEPDPEPDPEPPKPERKSRKPATPRVEAVSLGSDAETKPAEQPLGSASGADLVYSATTADLHSAPSGADSVCGGVHANTIAEAGAPALGIESTVTVLLAPGVDGAAGAIEPDCTRVQVQASNITQASYLIGTARTTGNACMDDFMADRILDMTHY